MSLESEMRTQIDELVSSHRVVLFMKGTRQAPQCGFSAQVVGILDRLLPDYQTFDVLSAPDVRDGIKEYSSWPTIPQLYIEGEFVGGCDIVKEMHVSGELHETLGLPSPAQVAPPSVRVTDEAAQMIREAMASSDFKEIHVKIDAVFNHSLGFGPREGGEVEARAGEFTFLFDPDSATRADGLVIGFAESSEGRGLTVENPNQPQVRQLLPNELQALMNAGDAFVLVDVRTPEERATAFIAGSRLLDEELHRELMSLPRDTTLVFQCHHGGRSQAASEQYVAAGFTRVHNLSGGIDAWSTQIDPSVPRY
jgi:monothiol glutaredoxin